LQAHLGDGREPDVWLVSSAFDAVGSGIIFDLAHIVRLVGEAQNYAPFIGWMLALPNDQWADAHRAEAAATLRELMRLLRHDLLRNYEYSAKSANRKLWAHQARGDEDANIVMLCEATADLYGPKAAEAVVGHMALALLALAQPEVWQTFRNSLRHQAQMLQLESQASIGAFGVCAHHIPLLELQTLVRALLTRDALLDHKWGAIQAWRPAQVEPDALVAAQVLRAAGHPFLAVIGHAGSHTGRGTSWPPSEMADQALASALRQNLQGLVDGPAPGNSLLACDALLAGVEEALYRSGAPSEQAESLLRVVAQARQELRTWLNELRAISETAQTAIDAAEGQWQRARARTGWYSTLGKDAPNSYYKPLLGGTTDIRQRIRQYVRWAWILEGKSLRLRLDTLYPGWKADAPRWRHAQDSAGLLRLWEGAELVVTALTREQTYWPSSVPIPVDTDKVPKGSLMLSYDPAIAQEYCSPKRLAIQASGDSTWCDYLWLSGGEVSKASSSSSTIGFLLQITHPITLTAVRRLNDWRRLYGRRRVVAQALHVFEAEQLAAELEDRALATVPWERREALSLTWLRPRTTAVLQRPDLVGLFVNAWLGGMVEPKFGPGPYRLLRPTSVASKPQTIRTWTVEHPLEALYAFVEGDLQRSEREELIRLIDALKNRSDSTRATFNKIARWWKSPLPMDVEWYLLVHGLLSLSGENTHDVQ
jgi:hypothetical protein